MELSTVHHGTFVCNFDEDDNCSCKLCTTCANAMDNDQPTYMCLFYKAEYRALQTDTIFPVREPMLSHTEPFDPETFRWEPPAVLDVLKNYFLDENNDPKYMGGPHIQSHILWAVTDGRICANRNKQLFVLWNLKHKPVDIRSISQLQMPQNTHLWKTLPHEDNFETLYRITETCQDVFDEYVRLLGKSNTKKRYNSDTSASFVMWRNYNNMPSFKTFRKDVRSDFEHKKYQWKYARRRLGGNNGLAEPCKPTKKVLPCVHKMLIQYHSWLPNFRTKRKRQKQLSFTG